MARFDFEKALRRKIDQHEKLLGRKNRLMKDGNGVFDRWERPVLTGAHAPLFWRYDLDPKRNPFLEERLGVNGAFNVGAIEWKGRICLMARVEGNDRKSFFAVAESKTGVDGFRFWDHPVVMPETDDPDTNVYDMRLTRPRGRLDLRPLLHRARPTRRLAPETPRRPSPRRASRARRTSSRGSVCPTSSRSRPSSATSCSTRSSSNGQYALYTRPQDSFIEAGKGGGIGFALCPTSRRPRSARSASSIPRSTTRSRK